MGFTVVSAGHKPPLAYWLEYIQSRGLAEKTIQTAGILFMDANSLAKHYGNWVLLDRPVGAAVIPANGDPGCEQKKFRFFFDPSDIPPATQKKPAKYKGMANALSQLYVPPLITDWFSAEYELIVVEGELNALRLAQDGFHAVGISGVHNYRVGDKTTIIIPALKALVQSKNVKSVTVSHDSDADERPDLKVGLNRLCAELAKLRPARNKDVFICLPKGREDGTKNGMDDYLHAKGIDEVNRLFREEKKAWDDHPFLQQEMRWVSRVIFNRASGLFYDNEIRKEVQVAHINMNMAPGSEVPNPFTANKLVIYKADTYLRSPLARIADGARYNPSTNEEFYEDPRDSKKYINLFHPDDIPKPIKGDVSIFYEVLNNMSPNSPLANKKIITVAAKHAQQPTTIPLYGLVFVGEQGSGKTLVARAIGTALSKRYHCARVNLDDTFNAEWRGFACKEWPEFDKGMDAEWLKDLITSETVLVRAPYQQPYSIDNYTLNIFTANQMKSVVQEGDRRMIISGWGHRLDPKLGAAFYEWVRGPGPNYLRHHLLYDVSALEYESMTSMTESRDAVIEASKSYKSSVMDLILEEVSHIDGLEVLPNQVLAALLDQYNVSIIAFNKEFAHQFIKPAKEVVKIDGNMVRFRAFKNHEKWLYEVSMEEYRTQYKLAMQLISNKKY